MKLLQQNIDKEYIDNLKRNYPFSFDSGNIQEGIFEVKSKYAGEIRFGPPYFNISVLSRENEIWTGRNSVYGGELFFHNILSERYKKLVLVKWLSKRDPNDQTIVLIDLENGRETEIFERQRYWWAGHFHSFDGIYYKKNNIKDILCRDFESRTDFLLFERINEKISNPINWSISSIENTIIVFSKAIKDNVILYNIRKKEVLETLTMPFELSNNGRIYTYLDKNSKRLLIQLNDYDLSSDNRIINKRDEYEIIEIIE